MIRSLAMACAAVALALPGIAGAASTYDTTVKALLARVPGDYGATGPVFFFGTVAPVEEPGCTGFNVVIVQDQAMPEASYKSMVATAMLAYSMGKRVHVHARGCLAGYPRVVGIDAL